MSTAAEQKRAPEKYSVPGFLEERKWDTDSGYSVLICFIKQTDKKTASCSMAQRIPSLHTQPQCKSVWELQEKFAREESGFSYTASACCSSEHCTRFTSSLNSNTCFGLVYFCRNCWYTVTAPQLSLLIYLPLTTHTHVQSSKKRHPCISWVYTCYTWRIELRQTLQLFLAGNLSRICAGHQMAFSRKAGTASIARLSRSTRIKGYPCRRCLVQQFASEI